MSISIFSFCTDITKGNQFTYESQELYRTQNNIQSQYEGLPEQCSSTTEGEKIHILWVESRTGFPAFSLKYAQFTLKNATETIVLDMQAHFCYWKLILGSDYLYGYYTSFSQYTNSTCDIYFIKTPLTEMNWTKQLIYSYNQTAILNPPSLTINENDAYLFWTIDNSILSISSVDKGETWSNVSVIHSTPNFCKTVVAGKLNNKLHLLWNDGRNNSNDLDELYYIYSIDNGLTWSAETKLIGIPRYTSDYLGIIPRLNIQANHIYILFTDTFGEQLYIIHSEDNGITWDIQTDLFDDKVRYNFQYSWVTQDEKIAIIRLVSGNWTLIQSNDYGETWTNITLEGNYENPTIIFINNHNGIIDSGYDAMTDESIIYYSELNTNQFILNAIELISILLILIFIIAFTIIVFFIRKKRNKQ
jgi:hypothetical protein